MVRLSAHHVFILSCGLLSIISHAAPSDSVYYTSASSSAYYLDLNTPQTSFASDSTTNGTPGGDNTQPHNPPVIHHSGDDGFGPGEPGIGGPEDDDASQFHKQQSHRKPSQAKRKQSKSDLFLEESILAFLGQKKVERIQPAPYVDPNIDPNIDPRLLEGDGLGTLLARPDSQVSAYTAGDATGIAHGTFPPPADVPPPFSQEEFAELERMLSDRNTPVKEGSALPEEHPASVKQEAEEIPTAIQVEPPRRQRAQRRRGFYICDFVKPNGEQCSKAHDTRAQLNHHSKNHGPKIHVCECGSRFAVRDQLAKHQRTAAVHATTSSYNCAPCNLHTSRRDVWTKHIKTEKHRHNARTQPIIHQAIISA